MPVFRIGKAYRYLGHTDYCSEWAPTFMKSVDAFSVGGSAFKLHDLPPYPINGRYANVIDQKVVNDLVNALFKKFDDIKLSNLSWSYWYAMCAPPHVSAIHFGSLIEQLQRNSSKINGARGKLLDDDAWRSLSRTILHWLKTADIGPEIRPILESKVSSFNQAPQGLVLKRLFETIGLRISEVETRAWRHRNMAAHGAFSDDPIEVILNSKILRILFHRILAGITHCSDRYIDYYNLGHPVRALTEAVPER